MRDPQCGMARLAISPRPAGVERTGGGREIAVLASDPCLVRGCERPPVSSPFCSSVVWWRSMTSRMAVGCRRNASDARVARRRAAGPRGLRNLPRVSDARHPAARCVARRAHPNDVHYEDRCHPSATPEAVDRQVQLPPDMAQVLPFYTSRAPEHLAAPETWPDPGESPVQFTRRAITMPEIPGAPAVSNVRPGHARRRQAAPADRYGDASRTRVRRTIRAGRSDALTILASIPHPSHVALADVDKDGLKDLMVADLGTSFPATTTTARKSGCAAPAAARSGLLARRLAARRRRRGRRFRRPWLERSGRCRLRVAPDRPHLDHGKPDHQAPRQPSFIEHAIDPRTGAIHVIPVDLNQDGKMDFVDGARAGARDVVAYINQRRFHLRAEGDLRGAASQLGFVRHPARRSRQGWRSRRPPDARRHLRRRHRQAVSRHPVAREHGRVSLHRAHDRGLAGVHARAAVDLDGDGDLDIVACALLAADRTSTRRRCRHWCGSSRRSPASS